MKNKKKGFTLVELIVVLAILAILAAMLVPALTGYIDKANGQKVVAECRQVVMAVQTETSSAYGKANGGGLKTGDVVASDVAKLAETKGHFTATIKSDGTVVSVYYENSGWKITYTTATGYGTPEKAAATLEADTVTVQAK